MVFCLLPFFDLYAFIFVWMAIAREREKPAWWGLLVSVPFLNVIVPGYLAWAA